jgi:hypothetical protein
MYLVGQIRGEQTGELVKKKAVNLLPPLQTARLAPEEDFSPLPDPVLIS